MNSLTHQAIGGALVFSPDNRFATMTDNHGHFELRFHALSSTAPESESRGTGRPTALMARKPGFLADHNPAQNLELDTSGKELTISLTPEALIVGQVALPAAEGFERISVEIYRRQVERGRPRWVSAGSVTTKSDGEFRFAELAAGSYKLLTHELLDRDALTFEPKGQLYGYPPVYYPNATDFASSSTIQLSAGDTFQADISLVRASYYPVRVAVTNTLPGVGTRAIVSVQGHKGPGFSLSYNSKAKMIEGFLPNGTYTLEASSLGSNAATGLLNITVNGAAVEGLRMMLLPNNSITFHVKEQFTSSENIVSAAVNARGDLSGAEVQVPNRYPNVSLEPADDFGWERTAPIRGRASHEKGDLVIDNVPQGRYWVRISSSRGFASAVSLGAIDLLLQPLLVGAGASTSSVEVTMRDDGAEIDGTVDGGTVPFTGATPSAIVSPSADTPYVYCVPLPDSTGEFREAKVSANGSFQFAELPPGAYRVLAFNGSQPELEYRNPEAMRAYDAKGQVIRLVAGQKEHLRLQLSYTGQ